jgi:hypothetical protein
MKTAILLAVVTLLSGCMYRVDVTKKHPSVLGEWRLRANTYIIQYDDDWFAYHAIACDPSSANSLPDWDITYSESRFGNRGNGVEIVGGLRKGSIVTIESVIEDHHATIGVSYEPFAEIKDMNGKSRRTNFSWFYRGFSQSQILNPEWAEKIQ